MRHWLDATLSTDEQVAGSVIRLLERLDRCFKRPFINRYVFVAHLANERSVWIFGLLVFSRYL